MKKKEEKKNETYEKKKEILHSENKFIKETVGPKYEYKPEKTS